MEEKNFNENDLYTLISKVINIIYKADNDA